MSDLDELEERMKPSLTDDQEKILAILYVVSASLSISGSFIIISRVLINRNLLSKPYHRIMFGLSFFDIIASLAYLLTPFLLPKETSTHVWARGSSTSCSFLGWLTQLGYAATFYNGVLSYYFLAVVRFSISPSEFASRFEPYVTAIPIFYFIFTATIGMLFHFYSEMRIGLGCWIAAIPEGCEETGNCIGSYIGWAFGGLPFLFTFLSLLINNIVITIYVRRALRVERKRGHTKSQRIQIQRVATRGFLYVVAFWLCSLPHFAVRLLGGEGYRRSKEADIYGILLLQASLTPLQGFFNMVIYIHPVFIRLKCAGASNWVALRGVLSEREISKLIPEVVTITTPGDIESSGGNSPDEDGLNGDNEVDSTMMSADKSSQEVSSIADHDSTE